MVSFMLVLFYIKLNEYLVKRKKILHDHTILPNNCLPGKFQLNIEIMYVSSTFRCYIPMLIGNIKQTALIIISMKHNIKCNLTLKYVVIMCLICI